MGAIWKGCVSVISWVWLSLWHEINERAQPREISGTMISPICPTRWYPVAMRSRKRADSESNLSFRYRILVESWDLDINSVLFLRSMIPGWFTMAHPYSCARRGERRRLLLFDLNYDVFVMVLELLTVEDLLKLEMVSLSPPWSRVFWLADGYLLMKDLPLSWKYPRWSLPLVFSIPQDHGVVLNAV